MIYHRTRTRDMGVSFEYAIMRNRSDLRQSTAVLIVDDGTLDQNMLCKIDAYPNVIIAEVEGPDIEQLTSSYFRALRDTVRLHLGQMPDSEGKRYIHLVVPDDSGWTDVEFALRWCLVDKAAALSDINAAWITLDDAFSASVDVIEDECARQLGAIQLQAYIG